MKPKHRIMLIALAVIGLLAFLPIGSADACPYGSAGLAFGYGYSPPAQQFGFVAPAGFAYAPPVAQFQFRAQPIHHAPRVQFNFAPQPREIVFGPFGRVRRIRN